MQKCQISVLHVAPIWGDKSQGLTYSIPALIRAQYKAGARCFLLCSGKKEPIFVDQKYTVLWHKAIQRRQLNLLLEDINLAVFHSTYILSHILLAKRLKRKKIPYIIVPRGGLTRGAGRRSRFKKWLADRLFFKNYVSNAVALHCLTKTELNESRHWHSQIFIASNGIRMPEKRRLRVKHDFVNPIKAVFIGRLSIYHKGLDLLLSGFALYLKSNTKLNWSLSLYGPSELGSINKLAKQINSLGLQGSVSLCDPVYDQEKSKVLREADLYCQTSRFEGHPMGVLEALSHELPCLLTSGTNFADEVKNAGAGFSVDQTIEGIARGFSLFSDRIEEWERMSRSAYDLASEYSWDKSARNTLDAYDQYLG